LTLLPFRPKLPRIRRKEPAIENELAGGTLSDAEFERLLASVRLEQPSSIGAGMIRPDMEREAKSKLNARNIEKETQHEDES
jgi:hypothetical protein